MTIKQLREKCVKSLLQELKLCAVDDALCAIQKRFSAWPVVRNLTVCTTDRIMTYFSIFTIKFYSCNLMIQLSINFESSVT